MNDTIPIEKRYRPRYFLQYLPSGQIVEVNGLDYMKLVNEEEYEPVSIDAMFSLVMDRLDSLKAQTHSRVMFDKNYPVVQKVEIKRERGS